MPDFDSGGKPVSQGCSEQLHVHHSHLEVHGNETLHRHAVERSCCFLPAFTAPGEGTSEERLS